MFVQRLAGKRSFDRNYFETLFGRKQDPWNFLSSHQQERLQLLLDHVPETEGAVLEVGCAEGIFTEALSGKARAVVAMEISMHALKRARQRCRPLRRRVHFVQADLLHLPFCKPFSAVICAGVLVYLTERNQLERTAQRILDLVAPGGFLVLEHLWESTGAELDGSRIHDHFACMPQMQVLRLTRHDEYGISVFQQKS